MKILVILTGGTIGSKVSKNIINVNSASAYNLIKLYQDRYGTDTEFEVIQPMNILSENLIPSYWKTLYDTLDKVDCGAYDGKGPHHFPRCSFRRAQGRKGTVIRS